MDEKMNGGISTLRGIFCRLSFQKGVITAETIAAQGFDGGIFSVDTRQKVPKPFWLRNFFCYLLYAIIEKNHPFYDWKRLHFRLSIEIIMFMY